MTNSDNHSRSVASIVKAVRTVEGEGFVVHRPFPSDALLDLDPFLLLDQMGPVTLGPGEAKGAPDHPHRGFETVTYLLEGRMEHKDSQGNRGTLEPGDVQWMTAGAGVVHAELPEAAFKRHGGRLHGFQLWVNLPRRDKMMPPRYQNVPSANIPVAQSADGTVTVKVIAGEAFGAQAVIDTRTPILYLHYTLQSGAHVMQRVPRDYNAFAYVIDGEGACGAGEGTVVAGHMVLLENDGDRVSMVATGDDSLNVLLIAGMPLREPIVRYGPFVMNTREEIAQAIEDYQKGRMGNVAHR